MLVVSWISLNPREWRRCDNFRVSSMNEKPNPNLIYSKCDDIYDGKSGFMVHIEPGGKVPSVVLFAVTLVRWPEWASALKIRLVLFQISQIQIVKKMHPTIHIQWM